MLENYEPTCIVTLKMLTMLIIVIFFIVEAGELELIKIKYNFLNKHCYHKNVNIFFIVEAVNQNQV